VAATRLILIRHGQTFSNVSGSLDTAIPGADLTPLGVRQAEALPEALADARIDRLHVSRLVRTQQTAAPLAAARGLEAVVTPDLEEISAGDFEMRSDEEAVTEWHHTLVAWFKGDLDAKVTGSETGHEFLARYDAAIASVMDGAPDDAHVAVVSHGAAIRLWTHLRVDEADDAVMPPLEERIENTGRFVLDLPAGATAGERRWRLVEHHLAPAGGEAVSDHDTTPDPTGDID
jgi:broad specificity phosphatase PhoE